MQWIMDNFETLYLTDIIYSGIKPSRPCLDASSTGAILKVVLSSITK